jgi:hypothetical protein
VSGLVNPEPSPPRGGETQGQITVPRESHTPRDLHFGRRRALPKPEPRVSRNEIRSRKAHVYSQTPTESTWALKLLALALGAHGLSGSHENAARHSHPFGRHVQAMVNAVDEKDVRRARRSEQRCSPHRSSRPRVRRQVALGKLGLYLRNSDDQDPLPPASNQVLTEKTSGRDRGWRLEAASQAAPLSPRCRIAQARETETARQRSSRNSIRATRPRATRPEL